MNATEMIAALAACAVPPGLMAAVSAALIIGDQAVRAQHHHRTQAAERQRRKRAADAESRFHGTRHVTSRDGSDAPTRDKENKQTNNNQEGTNDNHLIPEEWSPSEEDRAYAVAKGIDVEAETRRYVEYWRGRGRPRALAWRKDWSEAWRYHCDHYAHHPRPSPQRLVQARPGRVGNVWAAEAAKALANLPADRREGIAA